MDDTDEPVDLVQRVAALDIGKAALEACVQVPHETRPGRRCQEVRTYPTTTGGLLELADWLRAQQVTLYWLTDTFVSSYRPHQSGIVEPAVPVIDVPATVSVQRHERPPSRPAGSQRTLGHPGTRRPGSSTARRWLAPDRPIRARC